MAKVFITGSVDGLGMLAAKSLSGQGHQVVLHARNKDRALHARKQLPSAENILIADLASIEETKKLAGEVNAMGEFDAIIHNAGVYNAPNALIFHVNSLAPYILTCLVTPPRRLIYLSSGMHMQGDPNILALSEDGENCSYSDSKLHVVLLSTAVARKWPLVYSNSVDPGWVPTRMGGAGAPGNLEEGAKTQVWLAVSEDSAAKVTGRYFHHQQERSCLPVALDVKIQEEFLSLCKKITGVSLKSA